MGSTRLDTLVGKSVTSGNKLAGTPADIPTTPVRKALEDLSVLHNHQALIQVLEEIRSQTGHNFGGADGVTNGTTAVTVVPAPATGFIRRVESFFIHNADTATATVQFRKDNGSSERLFLEEALTKGTNANGAAPIVLSPTDSLEMKLLGVVTTRELDWVVSWRDYESI